MVKDIDPFTASAIIAIILVQVLIWGAHFFVKKWKIPGMSRGKVPSFFMDTATGTATVMFTVSLVLAPIAPMFTAEVVPDPGKPVEASMLAGFIGSAHDANPITLFIIGFYMLIAIVLQMLRHWETQESAE
ncbi:hypothetical protein ACQZ45_05415 [Agrobacterium sp. 16-2014-1-2a]